MTTWAFGDGSELRTGGRVTGRGPTAQWLRARLEEKLVHVLPLPMAPMRLDLGSDFLLDVVAQEAARATRTRVDTEYEPNDDDAPAEIREALREHRAAAERIPYGTIH